MQTTRRTLFGLLTAGCLCGLVTSLGLRPPIAWLSMTLFFIGLASPFGLVIWSAFCLESEKVLTRVALGFIFIFMAVLCYVIANLPA